MENTGVNTNREVMRLIALDVLHEEYHTAAGILDWLLHDRGHSIARVEQFISKQFHVNQTDAHVMVEFLVFH